MSGPTSAAEFESMFADFVRATGPGVRWHGGHLAGSVQLLDGRRAWLFGPLRVGPAGAPPGDVATAVTLQNALVVQREHVLGPPLVGGPAEDPRDLVPAYGTDRFLRPGAGVVEDRVLKVLYGRYRSTGAGWWDVQRIGTSLAEFELPALTLRSVTDLPLSPTVGWGAALLVQDGFTYVYGTSVGPARMTFAHVARARVGRLAGPWQFWDGVDWAAEERHAAPVLSGVGHGFAVCRALRSFVMVSEEHHLPADRRLVIQALTFPHGPAQRRYGQAGALVAPDGLRSGEGVHSAAVHLVVEPTTDTDRDPPPPSDLVVSYHVTAAEADGAPEEAGRPRFIDVRWPAWLARTELPAPDGVTASGQDDHVDLAWHPVPGATGYRVRMRDVTAGQIGYTLLSQTCPTTSLRIDGLISGHRYRFTVASATTEGSGEPSPAVEVTPHSRVRVDEAVLGANMANSVSGHYTVQLQGRAAHRERTADYARTFAEQTDATVTHVFLNTIEGFSLHDLPPQQAVDLAAHPDILSVEQDARFHL